MVFGFNFERAPQPSQGPSLSPEASPMGMEAETPVLEGMEHPDELDFEALQGGDKVFVKTESGSRYLFEKLKDEPGKVVVYRKTNNEETWGVPRSLYGEGVSIVKKRAKFTFMMAGNGELIPVTTSSVADIEVHRGSGMQ